MKKGRKKKPPSDEPRLDRSAFEVTTFAQAEADDRAYWARQTPQARLRALELLRRINYGSAATERMQKIFEVVTRKVRNEANSEPCEPEL